MSKRLWGTRKNVEKSQLFVTIVIYFFKIEELTFNIRNVF